MSTFTSRLLLEPLDDGRRWVLAEKFGFWTGEDIGQGKYIEVPEGYVTDFASVPRVFWPIIAPWGRYGKASVLHDYLYNEKSLSRKEADKIFLQGMKVLGTKSWRRFCIYYAVKLFGGFVWNRH
jgi:hypothetical protein